MPDMTAGDDATQIHTDYGVINVGTILTVTEVRAIALDVARSVFLDSLPIAKDIINARTENITDEVIRKIAEKDEQLFERFKDPRFLGPLASSQRNFAETGDPELGGILSGLLADLAGEPIRSRREIVLRESIECAPKLTTPHLNALTVIFSITRFIHKLVVDPADLISLLDSELRPYFGSIPTDSFDYGYMGATQAGTYVPAIGTSIYGQIFATHRNAMYPPFEINEIAQLYAGPSIEQITSDMNEIAHMMELPYALSQMGIEKLKLKSDLVNKILSPNPNVINSLTEAETKFREFLRGKSINEQQFTDLIRDQSPELAEFFDLVERTGALHFQLSPVGIMLARHEMENRSPEMAAQVDTMFED